MLGLAGLGAIGIVTSLLFACAAPPPGESPFVLYSEVTGDGGDVLSDRIAEGMAGGISLHPPLAPAERELATDPRIPLVYFSVPSRAGVETCYPNSTDPRTAETIRGLARGSDAAPTWRLLLPEFDQSGGCWARGRPEPAGSDDAATLAAWMSYYLDTLGFRDDLEGGPAQAEYRTLALCVYGFCPQYAYEMGVDGVLLERNNDELGDLGPGLAMVRGASRQNGDRPWGVDLSTYRFWTGGPTEYGADGLLQSGWSASTYERQMFLSWAAGAWMIHNEPADYTTAAVADGLNPLGLAVRDFGRFVRAHPEPVEPVVTMAVVQDHTSGYEPRYGEFDDAERKWYRSVPWTPGDRALDRILGESFPGHERWGTVGRAPWVARTDTGAIDVERTREGLRAALAEGLDPRTVEPTGTTRWGQSLDVLTDRVDGATLARYDTVVVATSRPVEPLLAEALAGFVRAGGRLVLSSDQLSGPAAGLTGVRDTGRTGDDGTRQVVPTDAAPMGQAASGSPMTTRNLVGGGEVYLVATDHYLGRDGALVPAAGRLLDRLQREAAPVLVDGPTTVQYAVSHSRGRTLVTLADTGTAGGWHGTIRLKGGAAGTTVTDLRNGAPIPVRTAPAGAAVEITVPAYGVLVVAFEEPSE